jgi:hypothetical protein
MARPTLYEHAMTDAERMRRYRARKKSGEAPRRQTVRERAELFGISVRYFHYANLFYRYSVMAQDKEFLDGLAKGTYGKISMVFLAEVTWYGTFKEQRAVCERIKQGGAAAGRAEWKQIISDGKHADVLRRHEDRRTGRKLGRRRMNPHLGMVW